MKTSETKNGRKNINLKLFINKLLLETLEHIIQMNCWNRVESKRKLKMFIKSKTNWCKIKFWRFWQFFWIPRMASVLMRKQLEIFNVSNVCGISMNEVPVRCSFSLKSKYCKYWQLENNVDNPRSINVF